MLTGATDRQLTVAVVVELLDTGRIGVGIDTGRVEREALEGPRAGVHLRDAEEHVDIARRFDLEAHVAAEVVRRVGRREEVVRRDRHGRVVAQIVQLGHIDDARLGLVQLAAERRLLILEQRGHVEVAVDHRHPDRQVEDLGEVLHAELVGDRIEQLEALGDVVVGVLVELDLVPAVLVGIGAVEIEVVVVVRAAGAIAETVAVEIDEGLTQREAAVTVLVEEGIRRVHHTVTVQRAIARGVVPVAVVIDAVGTHRDERDRIGVLARVGRRHIDRREVGRGGQQVAQRGGGRHRIADLVVELDEDVDVVTGLVDPVGIEEVAIGIAVTIDVDEPFAVHREQRRRYEVVDDRDRLAVGTEAPGRQIERLDVVGIFGQLDRPEAAVRVDDADAQHVGAGIVRVGRIEDEERVAAGCGGHAVRIVVRAFTLDVARPDFEHIVVDGRHVDQVVVLRGEEVARRTDRPGDERLVEDERVIDRAHLPPVGAGHQHEVDVIAVHRHVTIGGLVLALLDADPETVDAVIEQAIASIADRSGVVDEALDEALCKGLRRGPGRVEEVLVAVVGNPAHARVELGPGEIGDIHRVAGCPRILAVVLLGPARDLLELGPRIEALADRQPGVRIDR